MFRNNRNKQRRDFRSNSSSSKFRPKKSSDHFSKPRPKIDTVFSGMVDPYRDFKNQSANLNIPSQKPSRNFQVIFYDTLEDAQKDILQLKKISCNKVPVNIVIKSETIKLEPNSEIEKLGKIYSGSAWALIHERRMKEGWYENTTKIEMEKN